MIESYGADSLRFYLSTDVSSGTDMKFDEEYRNNLMKKAENPDGLEQLWDEANLIDPEAMKIISKNDKKRIIRVLEIYKATGKTKTEQEILSRAKEIKYDYKVFGITMDREKLYERINKRVDIFCQLLIF